MLKKGCVLHKNTQIVESFFKVADLSPIHFRKQSATDGTKLDSKKSVFPPGFGGLIFRGQIYNPEGLWKPLGFP